MDSIESGAIDWGLKNGARDHTVPAQLEMHLGTSGGTRTRGELSEQHGRGVLQIGACVAESAERWASARTPVLIRDKLGQRLLVEGSDTARTGSNDGAGERVERAEPETGRLAARERGGGRGCGGSGRGRAGRRRGAGEMSAQRTGMPEQSAAHGGGDNEGGPPRATDDDEVPRVSAAPSPHCPYCRQQKKLRRRGAPWRRLARRAGNGWCIGGADYSRLRSVAACDLPNVRN